MNESAPFCLGILVELDSDVSGEVAVEPSSTTWICHTSSQTCYSSGGVKKGGKQTSTNTNLRLPDKYAVVFLTDEVALALHSAIVLPFRLIQNHPHPLPGGKQSGADVRDSAPLPLPRHLHH